MKFIFDCFLIGFLSFPKRFVSEAREKTKNLHGFYTIAIADFTCRRYVNGAGRKERRREQRGEKNTEPPRLGGNLPADSFLEAPKKSCACFDDMTDMMAYPQRITAHDRYDGIYAINAADQVERKEWV